MSVLENLELGATVRNTDLAANFARVLGYFPRLAERRQQVVGTLSGGEPIKARPMATICCSPPERVPTTCCRRSASPARYH